jgi:hypothetical protein
MTCPGGCCVGNVCAVGTQDTACGAGGMQCSDCTQQNDVCTGQRCVPRPPTCTPANCAGCCDGAGNCQPGFLNNQCGQNGVSCANCTQMGSTCDTAVTPRSCSNQQMTCPAPYPSCPGNVTLTPPPVQTGACAASDLQNAAAACTAGAHTAACSSFFQFEQQQKPTCAACLSTFDFDFNELTGILECASPFVSPSCDHTLGCINDCETKSCDQCPAGAVQQCENQVRNSQCGQYFQGAQCAFGALFGPASFCNPNNYQGNVGRWLQGVGGHYCGP